MSDDGWAARIAPVPLTRNGAGQAGLAVGVLAVLLSLWPPAWDAAVVVAAIGLTLALVGLARTRRGDADNLGTSIAGIAANGVAVALVTTLLPAGFLLSAVWRDHVDSGDTAPRSVSVRDVAGDPEPVGWRSRI